MKTEITVHKSIEERWTVVFNAMIKYQVPHTRFDQISNHKHDIHLYEKLSTKLLVQAVIKILRSCLQKLNQFFFVKYGFRSDCPEKI